MSHAEALPDPKSFKKILYEVKGRVAVITLNIPDKLNPIDHGADSMQREVITALKLADADEEVGCSVITGAGRAFSSGGVVNTEGGGGGGAPAPRNYRVQFEFLRTEDDDNERIRFTDKPVIGAINGMCYGAGFIMMCHFDIILASEAATFGLIETRFGANGADVLAYLVGAQWAKFLALSGELIDAKKAKEIGLAMEVFPADKLMEKALDLGRRIASMPRDAMIFNRKIINGALTNMGWEQQKRLAHSYNAGLTALSPLAKAADGRYFSEVRKLGWPEYRAARDAPYTPPWIEKK